LSFFYRERASKFDNKFALSCNEKQKLLKKERVTKIYEGIH
jgi:hypothetical protein